MFDKVKNLYKLQKQAKQIKKELAHTHIEAEVDSVVVIINGEQEVVEVKIPDEIFNRTGGASEKMGIENKMKLQNALLKAFNKAIKKSQQIAAEQMKDVMKEMGLGGNMGM